MGALAPPLLLWFVSYVSRTRDGWATANPTLPMSKIFAPKVAHFQQFRSLKIFGKDRSTQIFTKVFFPFFKTPWDPTLGRYWRTCTDFDFARSGLNRRVMSPKEKASLLCRRSHDKFGLQGRQIEISIFKFGSFFQNRPWASRNIFLKMG